MVHSFTNEKQRLKSLSRVVVFKSSVSPCGDPTFDEGWTQTFDTHTCLLSRRRLPSTTMHFPCRSGIVADIQRRVSRCRDAAFPHEPNFWTRSKKRMLYEIARYVVPTLGVVELVHRHALAILRATNGNI
ncbi:hypothetical protein NPIL_9341 [Nephila pilipes]|uniref:Uncharacterized protein n=1 Tax=Nephila pilipes TaxID=299642 RepID=A0A8X6MVX8_NEPPI|nr:hypothetical protein NPIL_9341 [Nephila pilipes]